MEDENFKTLYTGKMHVLACPKTCRAARMHEEAVLPVISFALEALNGKIKFTEEREPGAYRIGGEVSFLPDNCDLRKRPAWEIIRESFSVNTRHIPSFNNDVVMLLSKWSRIEPDDFERALKFAAPLHLV